MGQLPRVHSPPVHKDWHLCFSGHICEVDQDALEEELVVVLGAAQPVVFEGSHADDDEVELNVYLDWVEELNHELFTLRLHGFMLVINEREGHSCQDDT